MNIVISHVFGTPNKGDWVLLHEIINILNLSFPNAKLYGITRDPEAQYKQFPNIVWSKRIDTSFRKYKLIRNINILFGLIKILAASNSRLIWNWLKNYHDSLAIIDSADLIIMCPGGYWDSSHSSFISNLINLVLLTSSKKKIIWAPQSIEPISNLLLRKVFIHLLNSAELIYLREKKSYEYVLSLGITQNKLFEEPDLAFYHTIDKSYTLQNKSINIPKGKFITCTALKWHFPNSINPSESHKQYTLSIANTAKYLFENYKLTTVLVRQIGDSRDTQKHIDVLREIEELSNGAAYVLEDDLHPDELISVINQSLILIGSRMHSNIFAFLSGRPVVAISYQQKTDGIMKMMSLDDYVISIDKVTSEGLIKLIEIVLAQQDVLSRKIMSKVSEIRLHKTKLVKQIRDCVADIKTE